MKTIEYCGNRVVPSKVVCVGRNYVEHIHELDNEIPEEMVVFLKPNSSVTQELHLSSSDQIHYEAEICFLVQHGQLAGVGLGLDLTKREIQSRLKAAGLPWERSKAFNNSAVFTNFVELRQGWGKLRLELYINDQLIQEGGVDQMLYKPGEILCEIQSFLHVEDNDILMTGTPKGVGQVMEGDTFRGKIIEGLDILVEKTWKVMVSPGVSGCK